MRDGVGLAGRGVALTGRPSTTSADALAAIERDDEVGPARCGPVAFGALPFLPGAPGELVVPAVVVGKAADGTRWVTTDRRRRGRPRPGRAAPARRRRPSPSAPGFDPDAFQAAVVRGPRRRAGRPARPRWCWPATSLVEADRPLDVHAILLRLRATFGSSYRYSVDGFVGASPELLVARHGDVVRSHPLAGTAPRTGDPATDARLAAELIASTKDQVEHRIVIEMVRDTLLPWCSYLDWEAEPSIVTVANVQHLGTAVEGRLSRPLPIGARAGGAPSSRRRRSAATRAPTALAMIAELEASTAVATAGRSAGSTPTATAQWAVGIRCAEIDGPRARLFAGVGVVAGSDPDAELAETQAKFQAMLSAIVRP